MDIMEKGTNNDIFGQGKTEENLAHAYCTLYPQRKPKDKRKYDLGKQTPPQIQWTNRQQQHLKQSGHGCLQRVPCCEWTTGTGHNTRHTQTEMTGRKTVLQLQYFNWNRTQRTGQDIQPMRTWQHRQRQSHGLCNSLKEESPRLCVTWVCR